jgi:hypothetical protein
LESQIGADLTSFWPKVSCVDKSTPARHVTPRRRRPRSTTWLHPARPKRALRHSIDRGAPSAFWMGAAATKKRPACSRAHRRRKKHGGGGCAGTRYPGGMPRGTYATAVHPIPTMLRAPSNDTVPRPGAGFSASAEREAQGKGTGYKVTPSKARRLAADGRWFDAAIGSTSCPRTTTSRPTFGLA